MGKICNSHINPDNGQFIINDRTGESNINYQGMKMTIIKYNDARHIDVQFEDGYIAKEKDYKFFSSGNITNMNYPNIAFSNEEIVNLPNEEWRPVVGYERLYEVSNLGRVKTLPRMVWNHNGYYVRKPQLLTQRTNYKGYLVVSLTKEHSNDKSVFVHRIVAKAFIQNPKPNEYDQINHIDGIKTNNHVDNLEWCNNSINQIHAYTIGLNKHSDKAGKSKKPVAQIDINTGNIIQKFPSIADAARALNYKAPSQIGKVCNKQAYQAAGYNWKFIEEAI